MFFFAPVCIVHYEFHFYAILPSGWSNWGSSKGLTDVKSIIQMLPPTIQQLSQDFDELKSKIRIFATTRQKCFPVQVAKELMSNKWYVEEMLLWWCLFSDIQGQLKYQWFWNEQIFSPSQVWGFHFSFPLCLAISFLLS